MIKAIVTDIEGTTSSLAFVKEVLFPYARKHIQQFIRDNASRSDVAKLLDDVRAEVGKPLDVEAIGAQLVQWIDEDKKVTPLKALQGLIWEAGYLSSDFHGHVYDDVVRKLPARVAALRTELRRGRRAAGRTSHISAPGGRHTPRRTLRWPRSRAGTGGTASPSLQAAGQ